MTWADLGRAFYDIGKVAWMRVQEEDLEEHIKLEGENYLLDVVLDLEDAHRVWPIYVWRVMVSRGWAQRIGQGRNTRHQLTLTGREKVMTRKRERDSGVVERPTQPEKARDSAVRIERPDAEWNF